MGREGWRRMELQKENNKNVVNLVKAVINQCMLAYQHINQGQVSFKPGIMLKLDKIYKSV